MAMIRSMLAAGAASLMAAAWPAHALTFDLNQYDPSVDPTPGQTLAVMTVTDIAGGIDVDVSLSGPSVDFGTGGVMLAINSNLTDLSGLSLVPISYPPSLTTMYPATVPGFGVFTAGGNAPAPYAGSFDFEVLGPITTAVFTPNADGYYVTAYVDLPNGYGGQIGASSAVPEASTWAMMLIGFAGLGFLGYQARGSAAAAA